MINHPNRSPEKPFIAFSMVTGQSLAYGITARMTRDRAVRANRLDDAHFIEVLHCGPSGRKVWQESILLAKARRSYPTVFRGRGYEGHEAHLPGIALIEPSETE